MNIPAPSRRAGKPGLQFPEDTEVHGEEEIEGAGIGVSPSTSGHLILFSLIIWRVRREICLDFNFERPRSSGLRGYGYGKSCSRPWHRRT